jgi:uncharacterized radical SAM superfamily Fe-S cluster-containing enzyme
VNEPVAALPYRADASPAGRRVEIGGLRYGHEITSMCPHCLETIPGRVTSTPAGVVMHKTCAKHGEFESVIATDVASYERMRRSPRIVKRPPRVRMPEARGCPDDCGLCPAHDQHTCLAIVEITTRCNLPCPVCLADSTSKGAELSREQVLSALQTLIDTEGQPVPLQFAGGDVLLRQLGCDSAGCGCGDGDPRQQLAELLERAEFFSVGFHGMMDALCFDQERARRCCVHKLTLDGRLMPFCLYNIKYRPGGC